MNPKFYPDGQAVLIELQELTLVIADSVSVSKPICTAAFSTSGAQRLHVLRGFLQLLR